MVAFLRRRHTPILEVFVYPFLILLVNLAIVGKEFGVAYSAYLESNEGSFIAIAKNVASHPADLLWWPLWDLGLPFQNTYIPGLHFLVATFSSLSGHSASLSFHQTSALFFALGPVSLYFMARTMTGLAGTSWFAALAYSMVSPTAWLMPLIRYDIGGPFNLRRLHILAYYGEGPHTACLFFVPLAILFLYLALTRGGLRVKVAAGVFLCLAVLMNAFAAVILGIATIVVIAVGPVKEWGRRAYLVFVIGLLAYLWISPLLPPSVLGDIHRNSARDYPFNAVSAMGLAALLAAATALWFFTRARVSAPLRIFFLFTLSVSSIVLLAYYAQCNIVPQPHRYGTTMDMGICLSAAFGGAALARKWKGLIPPLAVVLVLAAMLQLGHAVRYARTLIQAIDVTKTTTYHVAKWMNDHLEGKRVFVAGAHGFHFNAFTDTPQFHGGHDPMLPSTLTLIGGYVIASGMNTGSRDMEICSIWLKSLGAHAFSVPGPISDSYYKPFTNPERFAGHFPLLWQESDTKIYAVPMRSDSLAHVLPAESLVQHFPVNGLDVDEMKRYVEALEDPALPEAPFHWTSRHSANIHAQLESGQAISVQERYMPGWTATVNGQPQQVEHDGLGFIVLKPTCKDCQVTIVYDGGPQWRATCLASLLATLVVLLALARQLFNRRKLIRG